MLDMTKKIIAMWFYLTIFGVVMWVIETFYPLGDVINNSIGIFGTFIGYLISIITLIGVIVFGWAFIEVLKEGKSTK